MDIIDLIKSRRSIRRFKPDLVPDDVMMKLLEAARWAPSWANTQCREFVVVKDPKIKAELSETLVPPRNPAKSAVANAPVVIAALGRKGVSGFYRGSAVTNKGDWFMFDVALAVQKPRARGPRPRAWNSHSGGPRLREGVQDPQRASQRGARGLDTSGLSR